MCRLVEPELFDGYDPKKKLMLRQVVITRDMPPSEVASQEEAEQFASQHGDKVCVCVCVCMCVSLWLCVLCVCRLGIQPLTV